MPLPLTVRHIVDFAGERDLVGETLLSPGSWDALRLQTEGPFAIAESCAQLEQQADERPDIGSRAALLDAWFTEQAVTNLVSYGVGSGILECWLARLTPDREMVMTEYAPQTLERLSLLFAGREVVRHDLGTEPPLDADLHLFHRIDTELSNRQWRDVLRNFEGVQVLVGATEVIGGRRAAATIRLRLLNRRVTNAGWLRNRAAFEALWRHTHDAERLKFGDMHAWHLTPKRTRVY